MVTMNERVGGIFTIARGATLIGACLLFAACSGKPEDVAGQGSICEQPDGAVRITGGDFAMGSDAFYPEEGPVHTVTVAPFWLDAAEVTVERFAAFVAETGYVSVAEKPVDPAAFGAVGDVSDDLLQPGGAVFRPASNVSIGGMNWWKYVPGANWRFPRGPAESEADRNEPVTQIAFEDALAFAKWAGGRLGKVCPPPRELKGPACLFRGLFVVFQQLFSFYGFRTLSI